MKTNPVNNIPSYGASSAEWKNWHESLKQNFGKKIANQLWLKAWGLRGNPTANDNELRTYMEKNGVKLDRNAWDKFEDMGVGISDFFGSMFRVGRITGIVIGGTLLVGVGYIIYKTFKNPDKLVGTAVKSSKFGK